MTDPQVTADSLQQRIAALSPERRALLQQRLAQQGLAPVESPLVPQPRPALIPLSPSQKNLWVLHQLNPNSSAYHIGLSWQLTGKLDISALEQSLQAIAQRHESLRTQFVEQDGQPYQQVLPPIPTVLPVADLRSLSEAATRAQVQSFTKQCVKRAFDLSRGPLCRCHLLRIDDDTALLLMVLHHSVADGWSRGVLLRELATCYRAFAENTVPSLSSLPIQYADYTLWQQQWLQGKTARTQLDYWRQQLAGLPGLELPSDRLRPATPDFASRTSTHVLPAASVTALKALSQRAGTTLFMTLLAAFKLLLHRYTAQDDIGVGVPVANRNQPEVEPLIGFFVNTIVLRTQVTDQMTFRQLLQQVKQVAADGFQHAELPFAKVVEALQPNRDLSQNPLFQVMFQLQSGYQRQNAATLDLDLPELEVQQDWLDPGQTKFDMTWHGIEREDGLLLAVEYRTDLFDEDRIQRMLAHFETLLEGILAEPDGAVANLPLITAAARCQLLMEWNQTQAPLPSRPFHQQFEAQVEQTPAALAAIDSTEKLTYDQLNRRANQLAHILRARGVGPETLVGICLPRSVALMVALLGVLKAGGAYVPVDSSLPAERVRFMLADAQVVLVVTAGTTALAEVWGDAHPIFDLIAEREKLTQAPDHNPTVSLDPDNLAYVIYTSGSTGQPKGTLLTHRGLSNYLNWCSQAYDVASGGTPVQSAIGFDATITALFAPLVVGQSVTLLPETHEVEALSQALQSGEPFSVVKLTPSHLNAIAPLLLHSRSAELTSKPTPPIPTRALILGGEALHSRDLAPWRQHFPDLRLVNEYGPTEAVVGCCVYDVPLEFPDGPIPIGRPIANVQLYILDANLEPVPVGVPGELYIGGAGVARGYLNRPDLTAERFVPNPFVVGAYGGTPSAESLPRSQNIASGAEPCAPTGMVLYRTGDRVRYRPDGTLEYLGRIDNQIKLRGYRIEPGEIEAALCQHPQVEQAVVVLRDDIGATAKLVAYVVVAESGQKSDEATELRSGQDGETRSPHHSITPSPHHPSFLTDQLPAYMLLDRIVTLEALPLTVNGKVDRQALPVPEIETAAIAEERPLTAIEQRLAAVWAAVLRRNAVGLHDNFFELGGDSILAMQIIAKARQAGLQLTPRQLFQHQTVAELATIAEVCSTPAISQAPVTGAVPLMPIQRDFFAQELPEPHHFNQAVMVTVAAVQLPMLAQALQALGAHHDSLRSRFSLQDDGWQQSILPPHAVTVPLDQLDVSHLSASAQAEALTSAVDNWQASLNLAEGPLLRAVWVRLGTKGDRLLLLAHHLIVDGVSWRILLEDLATAYQQLLAGKPVALPPKTHSIQAWAHQLVALAEAGQFETERAYWHSVCAPTAVMPVDFTGAGDRNTVASTAEIAIELEVTQTQALLTAASQTYHAQVNDLLLTALGQTLKSWTQSATVLVDLEGHGRSLDWQNLQISSELDVSRTVGWFTAIYPLRLEMPAGAIADQIRSVKEQVRSVPHQGIGYGILRHLTAAADPALNSSAAVSFNYLGQMRLDAASANQGWMQSLATESVGQLRSPQGPRRYLLDVIALIRDGRLQVIWRYSCAVHRPATIQAIAQRYRATLQSYLGQSAQSAEEATYTPSDFAAARVNQAQLDQLLSRIGGK